MPEQENSIVDLKKFLGTSEKPISTTEMAEFWRSCSDEEKKEFKSAKLEQ